jgi:D-arabinose 1-dehydrogenase-like Zn-dependent alcohol dehydrogenase
MMNERGGPRPGLFVLAAAAALSVMFGIAGISVGETSAQAGWWLVVVGLVGVALVTIELARR